MFPIAWAVVEVENKDSWSWFIELIKGDLGASNTGGNGWTVITDQQKGLMPAIEELLPSAEHRCCARHIYANMRKKYAAASLKSLFWEAAKSGTPEEFTSVMADLCVESKGAYDYLMGQNPTTWSRAYFDFNSKCDAVENNMCETLNGSIVEARYKPLIYMLEDIRIAAMSRLAKKKDVVAKWNQMFTPKAVERVEQAKKDHRFWTTTYNGDKEFEVKNGDIGYVVNVERCFCSCRMWSLSGIPCAHAISAIYYIKDNPYKYVVDCYKVEVIKAAYSHSIKGVDGKNLWPKTGFQTLLPPPARRMPGRPKNARRKGEQEKLDPKKTKVNKRGTRILCRNCKQSGHNRLTCKVAPNPNSTANPTTNQVTQRRRKKGDEGTSSAAKRRTKVKDNVPNGYGVYIAPDSGNTYFRGSGNALPVNVSEQLPRSSEGGNADQATQAKTSQARKKKSTAKINLQKSGIYPS